jgi:hypothetical protein
MIGGPPHDLGGAHIAVGAIGVGPPLERHVRFAAAADQRIEPRMVVLDVEHEERGRPARRDDDVLERLPFDRNADRDEVLDAELRDGTLERTGDVVDG